jgi:hypothetical protein
MNDEQKSELIKGAIKIGSIIAWAVVLKVWLGSDKQER